MYKDHEREIQFPLAVCISRIRSDSPHLVSEIESAIRADRNYRQYVKDLFLTQPRRSAGKIE